MSRKWYEKPMRIAALQCNFEKGSTLEVVDKWLDAGFNVEQLLHPIAEGYTAVFDPAQHADILSQYLRRAKARGLRIILYQNVHIIEPSKSNRKEEWAQRSAEGEFYKAYETYYGCCVNSPWRDYFLSVIDELGAYDIDGLFLDGPGLCGSACYCPSCRARYEKDYGGNMEDAKDLFDFHQKSRLDFVREVYQRFKRVKPEALCYYNLSVMAPSGSYISLAEELEYNDIVGSEGGFMFYVPPRTGYLWKPSVCAKMLEAVAPHKPRVVFMAGDQKSWSWYVHTAVETQLCIASSVANAANIWYGLHGSTAMLDSPGGRAAAELTRFLRDHEDCYDDTVSAARVAVMYSFDTEEKYRTSEEASDFYGARDGANSEASSFPGNFTQAFQGICDMLSRSGIPFDIVTDMDITEEKLARYDCILAPTCACLGEAAVSAIRGFVRGGGNLIATLDTSLCGPDGRSRKDFALGDVFGVTFKQRADKYHNFNYFSPCGKHALFKGIDIPLLPAPNIGLDIEPVGKAEVLARFHRPMPGRYVDLTPQDKPAIVHNRFGKGKSLYLAGTFAEMCSTYAPIEYRRLIVNAVRSFSKPVVLIEGGIGNVEVVARKQGTRLIVHLVNYAGLIPRPFERVAPQTGIRLHIPAENNINSARALMSGRSCAMDKRKDSYVIRVPKMRTYEVIVLE